MTEKETISFNKCISFLEETGIEVIFGETPGSDFLPGLSIISGKLIVDKKKLLYPGDILHEAAHIAVVPAAERYSLNAEAISARPQRDGEEMAAIAWSYAAAVYLGLDAEFVFHEGGYQSGGKNLVENFAAGRWIGVPLLQWMGMTAEVKQAEALGRPAYPVMVKWLNDL